MQFNIVDPTREDFGERAVSPAVTDADHRAYLERELRKMIERNGHIDPIPMATETHTSEKLAEMGFVSVTFKS